MTSFQTALLISLLCFSALTLILGGLGLYLTIKGKSKASPGLAAACQLILYQTITLLGVVEHRWSIVLIGLVCDLMLAVSLIAKDRRR